MKLFYRFFLLIIFLLTGLTNQVSCQASEVQSSNDKLTVMPAKFELWGNRGSQINQALKITNDEDEPSIIAISVQGFDISGEDGRVLLSEADPSHQSRLIKWIMFTQTGMQLAPKQTKIVNYTIDIPKDASPGGKYAAIVVSMDHVDKTTDKSSGSVKVMSLVLLSVSGDISDNAQIKSFTARKNQDKTVDFILRSKNLGNNHIKPQGMIVITNLWGKKVDEISLDSETILPSITRKMTTQWKPDRFLSGRYTATLGATYGQLDESLTTATSFWILPWPTVVFLALILLIFLWICKTKKLSNFVKNILPKKDNSLDN